MKKGAKKEESILRYIPDALTLSRIAITFVVIYMIFSRQDIRWIIVVFAVGALTDLFDGWLARKYDWKTEFGRKADMIADRFLWAGTALAFLVAYALTGELELVHYAQIIFIMSREIVSAPFAVAAFLRARPIPQARKIAKATTFMQGFALPALMLSIYYPLFTYVSLPLSLVILVTGLISAGYYISDIGVKRR